MIGRDRELAVFRSALGDVARGNPRIVHVRGDAGIGRTRLLQEFAALADGKAAARVLTRTPGQDDAPLGPLRRAETAGPLQTFKGALTGSAQSSDHFAHLIATLAEDTRHAPVWLLVDDLDRADEATQAFVERLLASVQHGSLSQSRIGLVLSRVSDGLSQGSERRPRENQRNATKQLDLQRFDTREVKRCLETRLGVSADEALVGLLAEASGGNPLLLIELTAHLRRSGALREAGGRISIAHTGTPGELTLPRDLTTLLRGRVSGVSDECRRAMTFAAFLGNEFDPPALAGLLGQDAVALDGLIAEAEGAALVEHRGARTMGFRHPAARQLLYATPDPPGREETHLRVCEGLIGELGDHADEHCLTITHHLIRAGKRADPATIVHFASRAADVAFRHHSYYLAGRYYQAAALAGGGLLPDEQRAALYCRAGEAFQRWSDDARSSECFRHAVSLSERSDDPAGCARALQGLLRNRVAFGEISAEAGAVAARLQRLLSELPEHGAEIKVRVHDTLAAYYHGTARYDIAETCAQTAMTIARNSHDPTLRCIPVTSLALAQMEQLRLTDAKTTWLEGLSYDRAAGASRYEGLHLQRLPVPLYCMGQLQEAARYNQASYHHNEVIGNTGELCINLAVDVMIANLRGDFAAAVRTGREAFELMATTRYLWSAPSLVGALAYTLTMQGRFDDADAVIAHLSTNGLSFEDTGPFRSTAARLTQLVDAHRPQGAAESTPAHARRDARGGLRGVRVGSLARLCSEAELALFQGRPERLSGVHDALEFVHRRGLSLALGWCSSVPRSLAISTALRNGLSRASACFDEASRLAERANAPLEHGRVALCRGLATLACNGADPVSARRALTEALDCFERLEAPVLAQSARSALSRADTHAGTH